MAINRRCTKAILPTYIEAILFICINNPLPSNYLECNAIYNTYKGYSRQSDLGAINGRIYLPF